MDINISQPLAIYEVGQRSNQEDALYPEIGKATDANRLFILCDGMGGHEHGEVASATVSSVMGKYIEEHTSADEIFTDEMLLEALEAAYQALDEKDTHSLRTMGTTLCLLYIHKGGVTLAHMGDSRIYHVRSSQHKLLYQSRDHSLVYDLYQIGEISYEEMRTYPRKNVITRAMQPGADNREKPAIVHVTDIEPGDCFYLCSDGMLELMENDELCQLLSSNASAGAKRDQLIAATKDNKDNHSAYIIFIDKVAKDASDIHLLNDEQTSKDNALNIKPDAKPIDIDDEDIIEVTEVNDEPTSQSEPVVQGIPLEASPSPHKNMDSVNKSTDGSLNRNVNSANRGVQYTPREATNTRNNNKKNSRWLGLGIAVVVLLIAGLCVFGYFYLNNGKNNNEESTPRSTQETSHGQMDRPIEREDIDARSVETTESSDEKLDKFSSEARRAESRAKASDKKDQRDSKASTKETSTDKPTSTGGESKVQPKTEAKESSETKTDDAKKIDKKNLFENHSQPQTDKKDNGDGTKNGKKSSELNSKLQQKA